MALKTVEGSFAVAETVKNCEPDVVACYPITPSTHIAEDLDRMYADGELRNFIAVESEFSAISTLIGASAAGARTFTATSSQGLALMHEALFNASGMRLPIVMCVANRALSAPLNIWNDHQDTISERDAGWLQIYCESNQETVDTIIQAYRISEKALIPSMVCMDGFFLTHAVEQIDVPEKELIARFLPKLDLKIKLDAGNPLSLGVYAAPEDYQYFREDFANDMLKAKEEVVRTHDEWAKLTGRKYGNGLWEEYRCEDEEYLFVGMGSALGNAKVAVDNLRKSGKKVGALRVRLFRPFPKEVARVLEGKKSVVVFEKALCPGSDAPLFTELKSALCEQSKHAPKMFSMVGGLGGSDVPVHTIEEIFNKMMKGEPPAPFIY
ncbi:MAG: pyruvate ferredoxin oxidoreductase [Candidatus Micrarchaeota archaeon]